MSLTLELYTESGRHPIWHNFVTHHLKDAIPFVENIRDALAAYDVQANYGSNVDLYESLTFKTEEDKLEFVLIWS